MCCKGCWRTFWLLLRSNQWLVCCLILKVWWMYRPPDFTSISLTSTSLFSSVEHPGTKICALEAHPTEMKYEHDNKAGVSGASCFPATVKYATEMNSGGEKMGMCVRENTFEIIEHQWVYVRKKKRQRWWRRKTEENSSRQQSHTVWTEVSAGGPQSRSQSEDGSQLFSITVTLLSLSRMSPPDVLSLFSAVLQLEFYAKKFHTIKF